MISEKLPKIYVPGKHSPVRQDSGSLVDIDFDIPSSTIRIRSLGTYTSYRVHDHIHNAVPDMARYEECEDQLEIETVVHVPVSQLL